MRYCLSGVMMYLLITTGAVTGADEFVCEMEAEQSGVNWEMGGDGQWQRGPVCGGLGFEVSLGEWPRLLQRGYLDHIDGHTGTREIEPVMKKLDLGQVRLGGEMNKGRLKSNTWCCREYEFAASDGKMDVLISRLSPAVLFKSDAGTLELFAGRKYVGERWLAPEEVGASQVHTGRGGRSKVWTEQVPGYVAYAANGEVVVSQTTGRINLAQMDEPWLLFWYEEKSRFLRTAVPNLLWRTRRLNAAMRDGDYFVPVDLPVLVTLENKPNALVNAGDSLQLQFGTGDAGSMAVMPLMGFHHPKVQRTSQWKTGLEDEVIGQCRLWTKRLGWFPKGCRQSRKVSVKGDAVTTGFD